MNLINEALNELKSFTGEKFLFLSTTVHTGNPGIYKARSKRFNEQLIIHFLFRETEHIKKVVLALNEAVDYLVLDCEDKIDLRIEDSISDLKLAVPILRIKANDSTVESLTQLIQTVTTTPKKIAISGCGNIGCKAALSLVEAGHQVHLLSRDINKSNNIISSMLKYAHTADENLFHSLSWDDSIQKANIVILTGPGVTILNKKNSRLLDKAEIIVDVGGKGIEADIVGSLKISGKKIYSLDSSPGLFGSIQTAKISYLKYHRDHGKEDMVPLGELGSKGQKLFDPLISPTQIIGICDGLGGFIKNSSKDIL